MGLVRKNHLRNEGCGERGIWIVYSSRPMKSVACIHLSIICDHHDLRCNLPKDIRRSESAIIPGFDTNLLRDGMPSYSSGNDMSQDNIVQSPGTSTPSNAQVR